jgi:hypothetical protein
MLRINLVCEYAKLTKTLLQGDHQQQEQDKRDSIIESSSAGQLLHKMMKTLLQESEIITNMTGFSG